MEAFHYRFHPGFRRAESIVESGELGELTHCSVTVQHPMPFRPDEFRFSLEDGGALMDLGCYAVHALRTLVREEPRVSYAASKRVHGVDITTEAKLIFPSGCSGAFRCSLGPEERSHRILLEGTKGHMTIVNFVSPQHGGTLHVVTNGQARHESISGETSYESQLEHVIAVVTSGARGLTGGADAIANMELLGAVRAAANR
jgi:predicted dehydrogenase